MPNMDNGRDSGDDKNSYSGPGKKKMNPEMMAKFRAALGARSNLRGGGRAGTLLERAVMPTWKKAKL